MKNIWQYFDNIICNILFVTWQNFVNVWQNTPGTIWSPCSGLPSV